MAKDTKIDLAVVHFVDNNGRLVLVQDIKSFTKPSKPYFFNVSIGDSKLYVGDMIALHVINNDGIKSARITDRFPASTIRSGLIYYGGVIQEYYPNLKKPKGTLFVESIKLYHVITINDLICANIETSLPIRNKAVRVLVDTSKKPHKVISFHVPDIIINKTAP